MYINGEWIHSNKELKVFNPANGKLVGVVPLVGENETRHAIEAADRAFPAWSNLSADTRADYLQKVVGKLMEKKEHLAQIITQEMGKPITNARTEVDSTIGFFRWYAEEARRVYGEIIPAAKNKRVSVIKQPVGVVAAITPWNFPLSMAARKLGPALAVGCTVILRPSREAPLSSVELVKILDEVGIPKGVVNLVIGGASEIVTPIMESKVVKKVSFTGSTQVGKELVKQSADTLKRVSMELGGHAPFIVFEDADIDLAVEGALRSKFTSAGQQCICANRLYIHESVYEEFATKFAEKAKELKIGDGISDDVQIGPLVNQSAVEKADKHVQDAASKGARVLCGGRRIQEGAFVQGSFYEPTVLAEVDESMVITYEETFGPVAPLMKFKSEEEVIKKANHTEYGLAAYFYTKDLSRMYRVGEALEYGMLGINDPSPFSVQSPFGGIKESGMGREGGHHGMEDYLHIKTMSVQLY
ncbi:NAD-dependent succinate-semialdehyde dehydrogenase [Ammoniphilus sp. 3BR4]|uniref:NAD-dependent succinate-semialdehyde dehydrogenase n=1 Tax=Ammoniphilus sp. 3BR4 TaxID=3158265 RepID=UPI0034662C3C